MAELTIHQVLEQAIEAHKAGKVQEADRLYTAIIKVQPKHPDANHNLGLLAVGVGKVQEALPLFKTALDANPATAQFWLSYIEALIRLDKLTEAKVLLDKAKIKGAKGDGFDKLEKSVHEAHQVPPKAIKIAAETQPKKTHILDNLKLDQAIQLAKKKIKEGSSEEAKHIYQDILSKFPKNKRASDGLKNLAYGALDKGSKIQEPSYEQQQLLSQHYAEGQLHKALEQANALLRNFPNSSFLYNYTGAVYKGLGQLDLAIENYTKAIKLVPDLADYHNNLGNALKSKGTLDQAIEAFGKALLLSPNNATIKMNLSDAKRRAVPFWHIAMMNDTFRNKSYFEALNRAILKDDFVLEIGTGSGLLAMMAADSGASNVVTCESSKPISKVAQRIISDNGYSDKIVVINKKSTELVVGEDLPRKADVIISEILSAEFIGEGVQPTILDANKRLLRKNGKMLPKSGDIKIALLKADRDIDKNAFVNTVNGFDLSKFNSLSGNKLVLEQVNNPIFLSEPEIAFHINLLDMHNILQEEKVLNLAATDNGVCIGIIQWLSVEIFDDIIYENRPDQTTSHWPTPIYLFDKPMAVVNGQVVKIQSNLFTDSLWFDIKK